MELFEAEALALSVAHYCMCMCVKHGYLTNDKASTKMPDLTQCTPVNAMLLCSAATLGY